MSSPPHEFLPPTPKDYAGLEKITLKIMQRLDRDALIQGVTHDLQSSLGVDRIALYYFFSKWKGRVTFEALSQPSYSIIGMTGADDCFNDEYAALYEAGRYRAIEDIETEPIHECHRDFLHSIEVKSNLVVPILTQHGLWGLFAAHHCQETHAWSAEDIAAMQGGAAQLASSSTIMNSSLECQS